MARLMRTTIIGGILFLVPLAFVGLVLEHAWRITARVLGPVLRHLPAEHLWGKALVAVVAVLLVLVICLVAGLAARHSAIARRMKSVDTLLIDAVPGYAIAKSTLGGMARADEIDGLMATVVVQFDDHAMLAFEVQREGDDVVVFLPGSPSAWAGSTVIVPADRVALLDLPVHEVNRAVRTLGRGTLDVLRAAAARREDTSQA